jgi:hypothetical protein
MSSTSDASHGTDRRGRRPPDGQAIARSILIAGALLTGAWFLGLILLARWLITMIF